MTDNVRVQEDDPGAKVHPEKAGIILELGARLASGSIRCVPLDQNATWAHTIQRPEMPKRTCDTRRD